MVELVGQIVTIQACQLKVNQQAGSNNCLIEVDFICWNV